MTFSALQQNFRRESIRLHLEAFIGVTALLIIFCNMFIIKPFERSSLKRSPARAYVMVGSVDVEMLRNTGPDIYISPDALTSFSAMRTPTRPLTPQTIPPRSYAGGRIVLAAIPFPRADIEPYSSNPLMDWILTRPFVPVSAPEPMVYPKFILGNGELFPDPLLIPTTDLLSEITRYAPNRPTLLSYRVPENAILYARVRLESSCGVPLLDEQAKRALQRYMINHNGRLPADGTVRVVWRDVGFEFMNDSASIRRK